MFKNIYVNKADLSIQKVAKPFGSRANFTTTNSPYVSGVPIPKNYNWLQASSTDDDATNAIKKIILRPSNQGNCGNCYAFATTSVLSDLYCIKYGYAVNPDLSPAYLNINYPSLGGCGGGDPISALDMMLKNGITGNRCVDNSACLTNPKCNGSDKGNTPSPELNGIYEAVGKGCYNNTKDQHHLYYPKASEVDPTKSSVKIYPDYDDAMMNEIYQGYQNNLSGFITNSVKGLLDYPSSWPILTQSQKEVRTQIFRNGPAIGMMCVTSNFMTPFFENDDFIDVFDGIFFDSVVWNDDGTYKYSDPQLVDINSNDQQGNITFDGGHAVAIVGYGVSNVSIPLMDFKNAKTVNVKNIPFWWVRNSWTTDWNPTGGLKKGNDKTEMAGCVKIAMYPFNKVIQFDVPLDAKSQYAVPSLTGGYIDGLGGMIITEAGVSPVPIMDVNPNSYATTYPELSNSSKYLRDPSYYLSSSRDVLVHGGIEKTFMGGIKGVIIKTPEEQKIYKKYIIIAPVILILALLVLFILVKKKIL